MADPLDTQQVQTSISRLLGEAAKQLAYFLETILPSLVEDWWKQAVVNNVSYQLDLTASHDVDSMFITNHYQ